MARLAGVDIPNKKKIRIALTYIYGIGLASAEEILSKAEVDPEKRAEELEAHHSAGRRILLPPGRRSTRSRLPWSRDSRR